MISKHILALCAAGAVTTGAVGAVEAIARDRPASDMAALLARAAEGHEHLMRGDIAGYRQALEVTSDFTLMDPFGGQPTGAPRSDEHWHRIGRFFRDGRDASFEPIAAYRSADLIVLVANERAHVGVGLLPAQDWSLRVTLVFRRDDGIWRLAHRHADPLVKGISLEQAAAITGGGPACPARP